MWESGVSPAQPPRATTVGPRSSGASFIEQPYLAAAEWGRVPPARPGETRSRLPRLEVGRIMKRQLGRVLMACPCDLTQAGRAALAGDRRLGPLP
jgi:hypothetical protein